jgi:hypothetical protein
MKLIAILLVTLLPCLAHAGVFGASSSRVDCQAAGDAYAYALNSFCSNNYPDKDAIANRYQLEERIADAVMSKASADSKGVYCYPNPRGVAVTSDSDRFRYQCLEIYR